jgi:hypothetical protein
MIRVSHLVKKYGDLTAHFRLPGSERRRKNDHDQNAYHASEADQR